MKQLEKAFITIALSLSTGVIAHGQNCLLQEFFNGSTSITTTSTDTSSQWRTSGFDGEGFVYFNWEADGDASGGAYWGSRERIASISGGGAAVFNADSLTSLVDTANFELYFPPYTVYLTSPEITVPPTGFSGPVFLTFYQYYRKFDSEAVVEICTSGGCGDSDFFSWDTIYYNNSIGNGMQTPNGEKVIIDLTPYLDDGDGGWWPSFRIRFHFAGEDYFWIIDDVTICENQNPRGCTEPAALGEYLYRCNAYETDSICSPYVPNQLIVEFKDGVPDTVKIKLRDSLGVDKVEYCDCNPNLELWTFYLEPHDEVDYRQIDGVTKTYLFEKKKPLTTNSNLQGDNGPGVSYNYITVPDMSVPAQWPCVQFPVQDLTDTPAGTPASDTGEVVVAILDTGVDLQHPEIAVRLRRNQGTGSLYPNDKVGHNFAATDTGANNPDDAHGHGTRIALRMIRPDPSLPSLSCNYKILPLKTHDDRGVGTLFSNTCAMYYALKENAKVVNLSWGWRGEPSGIVARAIDSLHRKNQAVVVVAAGNDTLNMLNARVYPAYFNLPNIVVVGSFRQTGGNYQYSDFANFSNQLVDISALGEDIPFPGDTFLYSGTSYAAPPVTSAIAALYCLTGDSSATAIIEQLYDCADQFTQLAPYVVDGRALSFDFPCVIAPEVTGQLVYALTRDGSLIAFDSKSPAIIRRLLRLGGVAPTQTLRGLDFRPATGELFALGYNQSTGEARLYTINLVTGAATPVGAGPVTLAPGMGNLGMDFNPVADRVRVTGSDNSNYRLHPVAGTLEATDADLAFASGDVHSGVDPAVGTVAYSNSYKGATSTVLYACDDSLNAVATLSPPNAGALHTIGTTGIEVNLADPSSDLDIFFDPFNGGNIAYLAANAGTATADDFYTVELASGAAALVGKIGGIDFAIQDIAVRVPESEIACDVKVIGCIKYEILSITADSAQDKTFRVRVTNNCADELIYTAFRLPNGVTSAYPPHSSVYASPGGHAYDVRNPSFSPFYAVRFKEQAGGIAGGQADIFEFSLPGYSNPNYIYVTTLVGSQVMYGTHLNVFGCTVSSSSAAGPDSGERAGGPAAAAGRVYVYPNPTQGALFVDLAAWRGESVRIRVLNGQGQQVAGFSTTAGDDLQRLELPGSLPDGLYWCEFLTGKGGKQVERFVLQR